MSNENLVSVPETPSLPLAEDRKIQTAKARRISDDVHLHDLVLSNGKPQDSLQFSTRSPYQSGAAVDQGWFDITNAHAAGKRGSCSGPIPCAAYFAGCAGSGDLIKADNDVRVEHGDQAFDIAATQGSEERIRQLTLPFQIGVRFRRGSLNPATRAAGELPGGDGGTPNDRCDLFKGQTKRVMQHERQSFGRGQSVEDNQSGDADRFGHSFRASALQSLHGPLPVF